MPAHSPAIVFLVAILSVPLSACAVTSAAEEGNSAAPAATLNASKRKIDWDRAVIDAGVNQRRSKTEQMAVPMLLPPAQVVTSASNSPILFASPKILNDKKGYSAVITSTQFDMLIDASNQMMITESSAMALFPQEFDGDFQLIENGGQLTIGRYGAIYAIQFMCTDSTDDSCITEQLAHELVQSLQVHTTLP